MLLFLGVTPTSQPDLEISACQAGRRRLGFLLFEWVGRGEKGRKMNNSRFCGGRLSKAEVIPVFIEDTP